MPYPVRITELVFEVVQEADGGYCAECLTASVFSGGSRGILLRPSLPRNAYASTWSGTKSSARLPGTSASRTTAFSPDGRSKPEFRDGLRKPHPLAWASLLLAFGRYHFFLDPGHGEPLRLCPVGCCSKGEARTLHLP
jgi:hypothetical protein